MKKRIWILLAGCMELIGCSTSQPVAIDGEDNQVNFPGGEITYVFDSGNSEQKQNHTVGITAGYFRGEGQFKQQIGSGESAVLDTGTIDGPAILENTAKIDLGYLKLDYHSFLNNAFEWHGGVGLGYLAMDFDSETTNQHASTSNSNLEMALELGLAYYFTPSFGVDGSVGFYFPISFFVSDISTLNETRLQLFWEPMDSVRLFAGYRDWSYAFEDNDAFDAFRTRSPISLNFSGPTAGVALRF